MRKNLRLLTALLIFTLMINVPLSSVNGSNASGGASDTQSLGTGELTGKDETVYARLSADGVPQSVYVVNHFTARKVSGEDASGYLTAGIDYGDYRDVVNLSNTFPLSLTGDEVSFQALDRHYYYQGNLNNNNLPWNYTVRYSLEGAEIDPSSIAGQTGAVEIRVGVKRNENVNPVFAEHYMQQITLTLDTDLCLNIEAPGATQANNGKNRVLNFTVLPDQDAEYVIKTDAIGFEMPGIDITAMPFNMDIDIPEVDGMLDGFNALTEGIAKLNDGVGELNTGAAEMRDGAVLLADGSREFNDGLTQIGANTGQLTDASALIRDGLTQMAQGLAGADFTMPDMTQMGQLPAMLTQMSGIFNLAASNLTELNDGYTQAFNALDGAINGIPEAALTEAEITGLYAMTDQAGQDTLDRLVEGYNAAATVRGTYASSREVFANVSPRLTQIASNIRETSQMLATVSTQIGGALTGLDTAGDPTAQLQELVDGITLLSQNYSQFHEGLVEYADGVVQLAEGYPQLNDGVAGLSEGIGQMTDGIGELYDGTSQMAEETAGLPDTIQNEINSLTEGYGALLSGEFTPVSFTSERNENISFVQFVFKTAAVELPAAEVANIDEGGPQTFFERLLDLFR